MYCSTLTVAATDGRHDVCPLNGRKLSSKQTSPNYALKRLIAYWAAAHSITLPRAPTYHTGGSDHNSYTGSGAAAATAAAVAASTQGSSYSSTQTTPGATIIIDMGDGTEGQKTGASTLCRCTRTRWAVGAIVVLLVAALGIGLGVGIPMVTRRSKGDDCLINEHTHASCHLQHIETLITVANCLLRLIRHNHCAGHHATFGNVLCCCSLV
jgi:hypothetical protein